MVGNLPERLKGEWQAYFQTQFPWVTDKPKDLPGRNLTKRGMK